MILKSKIKFLNLQRFYSISYINYIFNKHNKTIFLMANIEQLDNIDLTLLQILQENSKFTTKELSAAVGLSATPVYERIKRMEEAGFIQKYVAVLDPDKLNLGFEVFCNVKLSRQSAKGNSEFLKTIRDIHMVTECYSVAGSFDYLLKIHAPDMAFYRKFVVEVLGNIESIGSLESTFVMSVEKRTTHLPLGHGRAKGVELNS